jgi:plastocyanin
MRSQLRPAVAAVVLAVATACSGGDDPKASGPAIEMTDFAFDVVGVELSAGRQATIRVTNRGAVTHDLSIPAIDVSLDYEAGHSSNLIFIVPSQPGSIEFFCKYHRDRGMQGTLVVRG